jgi:hypothetical protein
MPVFWLRLPSIAEAVLVLLEPGEKKDSDSDLGGSSLADAAVKEFWQYCRSGCGVNRSVRS